MNCHQMETQNVTISFDYSWFLAKNLAYAKCRIAKFHYRNSSNMDDLSPGNSLWIGPLRPQFLDLGLEVQFDILGFVRRFQLLHHKLWHGQCKLQQVLFFLQCVLQNNNYIWKILSNYIGITSFLGFHEIFEKWKLWKSDMGSASSNWYFVTKIVLIYCEKNLF